MLLKRKLFEIKVGYKYKYSNCEIFIYFENVR